MENIKPTKSYFRFLAIASLLVVVLFCCCSGEESSTDFNTGSDDEDLNPANGFSSESNDDDDDDDNNDDDNNDDSNPGPYYADFQQYWKTMDEGYAYFDLKGVDWDSVYSQFEPVAYMTKELGQFSLTIAQMTALLHDSHTWSSLNGVPTEDMPFQQATGVCLERLGNHFYIANLNQQAELAGIELGDEVVALDNENVDTVLQRAKSWEGCSSDHCCDHFRLPYVDRYSLGAQTVTYEIVREGVNYSFDLQRQVNTGGLCPSKMYVDFLQDTQGTVLRYKDLGSDLGYIQLSTLSDSYKDTILSELDAALTQFAGKAGIVFDARYNHGGSDLVAMAVLFRFLGSTIWPVEFRYKNGPGHNDFTSWLPQPVFPGNSPVATPVVFLMNGGCVSAAEFFTAAASYVPTFVTMGTTTCGGTGAPKYETLPVSGVTFYYSQMQRKFRLTDLQIEGNGIEPQIRIEIDPDDLANGLDTQLQAAMDYLDSL